MSKKAETSADSLATTVALQLTQGDMNGAMEALRRGLRATKSQRTTVDSPLCVRGKLVYDQEGKMVMGPHDAYEIVDDYATQVVAAKIIIEQGVGYPVKKSETLNLHKFVSLDQLLLDRLAGLPVVKQVHDAQEGTDDGK